MKHSFRVARLDLVTLFLYKKKGEEPNQRRIVYSILYSVSKSFSCLLGRGGRWKNPEKSE